MSIEELKKLIITYEPTENNMKLIEHLEDNWDFYGFSNVVEYFIEYSISGKPVRLSKEKGLVKDISYEECETILKNNIKTGQRFILELKKWKIEHICKEVV